MTTGSVGAVVLAAGSGSRVGGPKLRMMLDGRSFLAHAVTVLASGGVEPVCCVVSAEDAAWARQQVAGAPVCVNTDPARGMFSSLVAGLAVLQGNTGAFVAPVDHPYVHVSTIKALLTEFRGFSDHVIKPVYHGRAGHPVVLPEHLFPIIQRAPGATTLREVLGQTGVQVRYVDVDDGGVLVNVNTPADLR